MEKSFETIDTINEIVESLLPVSLQKLAFLFNLHVVLFSRCHIVIDGVAPIRCAAVKTNILSNWISSNHSLIQFSSSCHYNLFPCCYCVAFCVSRDKRNKWGERGLERRSTWSISALNYDSSDFVAQWQMSVCSYHSKPFSERYLFTCDDFHSSMIDESNQLKLIHIIGSLS